MSFLQTIKTQLYDERKQRGRGARSIATVDRKSLEELIRHFESLDSEARDRNTQSDDLHLQLHVTLEALYKEGRDGERLMMIVMDTLAPLIRERVKQERANVHMRDYTARNNLKRGNHEMPI